MPEDIFIKLSESSYKNLPIEERDNIDTLLEALKTGLVPARYIPAHFFTDIKYARKILEADGRYIEYTHWLQDNREMALIAVKSAGIEALKHINSDFLQDYEIGWAAIEKDTSAIKLLQDLSHDKTFCIKACILNPGVFQYIAPELQKDLDVVKPFIAFSDYLPENVLSSEIINQPDIAKILLERHGGELSNLNEEYQQSEEYARIAMKSNKYAYESLSDDLKHRQEFIDMAKGIYLWYFPEDVLQGFSKEYLLEAAKDGLMDSSVLNAINADRDVIKEFLNYEGGYLPKGYEADEELALIAMKDKCGSEFFESIDDKLLKDKNFALKGIEVNIDLYRFLPGKLQEDEDIVLKLLTSSIGENVQKDESYPYSAIPEAYKHDKRMIEFALKQNPETWRFLTPDMQTNENFALALKSGLNTMMLKEWRNGEAISEILKNPTEKTVLRIFPPKVLTEDTVKRLLEAGADIKSLPKEHPIRNDKEALLIYFSREGRTFDNNSGICSEFDVGLAAVKSCAKNIEKLTDDLRKNPEIKKAATKAALRDYSDKWYEIPHELQTKEMILNLLERAPDMYMFTSSLAPELRKDFDIGVLACKLDRYDNLPTVDKSLLENIDFLNAIKRDCPQARYLLERKEFLEVFDKVNTIKRVEIKTKSEIEV